MFIISIFLILIIIFLYLNRARSFNLPGPKHYPLIGSLLTIIDNADRSVRWMLEESRKNHWQNWAATMPGTNFVVVMDEPSIKFVLQDEFESFEKGEVFREGFHELLQHGIFAVDGAPWKTERKIASHLFSARMVHHMSQCFIKHSHLLCEQLAVEAAHGQEFDLQEKFARLTFRAFCEVAFGFDIEQNKQEADDFSRSFDRAQFLVSQRFFIPQWLWKIQRALKISQRERLIASDIHTLRKYVTKIVETRLQNVKDPVLESHPDLLSLFLRFGVDKNRQDLMTVAYLSQMVMNFLIAGRDTTSCLLTFLHMNLASHPHLYERFRAEVVEATQGGRDINALLKADSCPFVEATIRETLRLTPPVAVDVKFSRHDITLPNGIRVPKGSQVVYPSIAIGHSPLVFEDPEVFDPERFLEGKPVQKDGLFLRSNTAKPSDFLLPIFNAGYRICLGKTAALLEAKIVASILVLSHRFERIPPKEPDCYRAPVMFLKKGLFVKKIN